MNLFQEILEVLKQTTLLEYIAVFTGIGSVLLSRVAHIGVYPVGLISTIIYTYISVKGNLLGEASVNIYYTVMSFYGWYVWAKRKPTGEQEVVITNASKNEWRVIIIFTVVAYVGLYLLLILAKNSIAPDAIPWADAFASATAYTGMWLMARKKVENWWLWIISDIASIPLYYYKGYKFTGFQFLIFTALAIWGLYEWKKRVKENMVYDFDGRIKPYK